MAVTKERQRELARAWYLRNKEITIARAKTWQQENPERKRVIQATWRGNNPEYNAQYYQEHKEELDADIAAWNKSHQVEMRSYRRDWQKRNPEKNREYCRRRRDRKAAWGDLEGLNPEETQFVYAQFNSCCYRCGDSLELALDHHYPIAVAPLCRGNAVLLCKSCNSQKNNKFPEDFYSFSELRYLQTLLDAQKRFILENNT
jgi:5-methylcytosine-specific restriction endonuclease McrA